MISLIVVDDSLLWFTGTTRMLYTDFVPNLVIFPLILAQYALALVSLFPYLKSHWAQNSKCSCLSVVIYCITECWSGLWSRIFVAFKHTASSSSSTSFFVPVFIYTLAFPDWSLSTHLGDDPVARPAVVLFTETLLLPIQKQYQTQHIVKIRIKINFECW